MTLRYTISLSFGQFASDGQASILDAALAVGTPVPFSCQRGECGSCRAQVLAGRYEPIAPPTERSYVPAADELLMCQCRAASDLTLRFPHWAAPAGAPRQRRASVVSRRPLTADVTELIVDIEGAEPFDYQPGQHVRWRLDDGSHRSFSIANAPGAAGPQRLAFHIRRTPAGRFTNQVLPALMPGDALSLDGPHGACVWPATPPGGIDHLVLLATGTGFAGVFPILMAALDSRSLQSVTLYWGGRQREDCYASGLLNALQGKDGVFRWHPVLSGGSSAGPSEGSSQAPSANGATGRHVQDVALDAGHDWARTLVYACGNSAMVRAAQACLRAAGLPEGRFLSEAFLPAAGPGADLAPRHPAHPWERVGERFTLDGILAARQRSMDAVHEIAALMTPGITTGDAIALADQHLRRMGASHNWHPTYVRFGADSQSPAVHPTDRRRTLGEDDIFVVDIGPVWDGYEGDYGDTFVTGADADRQRCAQAARDVFKRTRLAWLDGLTGQALYDVADDYAHEYGCALVRDIAGHRVSDFPHALYGKHQLANADFIPGDGIWVLEIQVRDLRLPIGAFYEDVLLRPATA
ncbi:NAD(P)H dependent flavin oxidoreductase family protein [Achromobacter sp. UMC46]|uniref:NAD(P)H dependent flavin oxidoreductase family protein n=1 Tax=Achromobacter sp. UMC46 TaxID=1862319 RepID=UPI00160468B8|nr:NAD(P)H dependent flavin oxidoreductase family protein [Achromobacter sp. UMC46]MBB1594243.1 2Fe-2S ferredoxin [Achromobacter sp. UMC46]